jgi:hypothetical protein
MVHVCIFDILVKHRYIFFTMFRMFPTRGLLFVPKLTLARSVLGLPNSPIVFGGLSTGLYPKFGKFPML